MLYTILISTFPCTFRCLRSFFMLWIICTLYHRYAAVTNSLKYLHVVYISIRDLFYDIHALQSLSLIPCYFLISDSRRGVMVAAVQHLD